MTQNNPPLEQPPLSGQGLRWTKPWHLWFQTFWDKYKTAVFGSGTSGTMTKWSGLRTITDSIYTETELKAKLRDYTATDWTYTGNDLTGVEYDGGDLNEVRTYNGYGHIATSTFTGDINQTITWSYNSSNDLATDRDVS